MNVLFKGDGRLRAWWRVAFFLLVTLSGGIVVATIAYEAISLTPLVGLAREYSVPLAEYGQLLGLLVGTYAAVRVADGMRDGIWTRVGLGADALRPRWLLIGLAAGALAILVPCGLLIATGHFSFDRQPSEIISWWSAARSALSVLAPAALAEELAMRGYLLTTLVEGVGAPFAIAITSVLFAVLHLLNPDPTFLSTGMVALAGLFLAVIRLTTDSLWAAWVAHLAWNLAQAVVLHAPVSGLPLATPAYRLVDHGPTWATGGPWGPEGGLAAAGGMLVATFLLVRFVKPGGFAPLARTKFSFRHGDVKDE
ncbi:MAG: lysostaphin resistance A-like protein [Gemmatimonadaceae bacterium]